MELKSGSGAGSAGSGAGSNRTFMELKLDGKTAAKEQDGEF